MVSWKKTSRRSPILSTNLSMWLNLFVQNLMEAPKLHSRSAKFQLLLLGFLKLFHDWQKFSGLQRSSRHRPRSLIPNQRSRWQCQWTSSIFPNSRPWAAVIHIPFQLSEFSVFSLRNISHDLKKSWKFSDFISENDPLGQIAKCYTCWHYQNGHAIRGRTKATAKGRK